MGLSHTCTGAISQRAALGLMVLAVCFLSVSAPADAALPGPGTLQTGFVASSLFPEFPSPAQVPASWYSRMESLDSSWTRIGAFWATIAPQRPPASQASDPGYAGYDWTYLDRAVRDATAARQQVLLTVSYPPNWALGPGASRARFPNTWRPDAHAFGQFARAVAARYSGHFPDPENPTRTLPRVRDFQAWNEPNLPYLLEPQWRRTRRGIQPASPGIYRALLNAFYANVKVVQPRAYVLAAGLAPYGDPPGRLDRMRPVQFLATLLCVQVSALAPQRCPSKAHADAFDMHPYALTPTIHAFNPEDVSVPDLGRLTRVLTAARRAARVLPRGPKPLWVSEVVWDSNPPDRYSGLPLATQARYLAQALYEFWRQGVSHVAWYEVRDPGFPAKSLTGSGLFFSDGRPKPSVDVFRFPFTALGRRGGPVTLWGRAPRAGRVAIERRQGRRWVTLMTLPTTRGGIFYAVRRISVPRPLRARSGQLVSHPY